MSVLVDDVDGADLVVDCRFVLADPMGSTSGAGRLGAARAGYLAGHLPGAVFADVEHELSANARADRVGGRHPLPDAEAFQAVARRLGISGGTRVVAYDGGQDGGAARLWWLLRHFGHAEVAVLRGGLAAWNGPLEVGEVVRAPGDFVARPRTDDVVDAEQVRAGLGRPGRVLLDARAPERYRGEHEPVDPVAGHIPGARNLPSAAAFPPPEDLVTTPDELVAYCGSGITASAVVLALAAAGRDDVKLYPGSWSDWVARLTNPHLEIEISSSA